MNSKLIADMLRFFRAVPADMIAAAKALPESKLDDLRDTLDTPVASDLWNGAPPAPQTGATESMSGDGVRPMTGRYSETAPQSTAGGSFEQLADRLCGLESAVESLIGHVFSVKADVSDEDRFPDSEDKEDEDETSSKSNIANLSVGDLMSVLSNRASKAARKAAEKADAVNRVATPPSMNASPSVIKSNYDAMIEHMDNSNMTAAERLDARIRMNALRLRAEGMPVDCHDQRITGPNRTGMAAQF